MLHNTIIAAEHSKHRAAQQLLASNPRLDLLPDGSPGPRRFKIKTADTTVRRFSANALLKHRYAWRGYQTVSLPDDPAVNRITLSAMEHEVTIGTITVVLDSPEGLGAEEAFGAEVAALREDGKRICEFTKLAIDPISGTKRVIAALFHVAYIIAHRLRGNDALVMEVNPRHVRYYERMLGARVLGEQRLNRKVNAPAVLLSIDFSYIMEQIGEFGGQEERVAEERSLYPLAFSLSEEAGMIARLTQAHKPPPGTRLN
jgi:hypothetical protein